MNLDSSQTQPSSNSLGALLHNLRDDTTTLLRQEVALAKAEFSEKASHLIHQALHVAMGGVVAYAGLIVLLFGLGDLVGFALMKTGLDERTALWIGRALVGLVVAAIGWGMLAKAKTAMAADQLKPERTLQTLRENKQWIQTKLHHSHEPTT